MINFIWFLNAFLGGLLLLVILLFAFSALVSFIIEVIRLEIEKRRNDE